MQLDSTIETVMFSVLPLQTCVRVSQYLSTKHSSFVQSCMHICHNVGHEVPT